MSDSPLPPRSSDDDIGGRPAWRRQPPGVWGALGQVVLCSGVPTQTILALALEMMGLPPRQHGAFNPSFIAAVALGDTVLVLWLIVFFLRAGGERPRDVFLGARDPVREMSLGVLLLPVVFVGIVALVHVVQQVAPRLHNVPQSPFDAFFSTPARSALFAFVAIFAGGVREELQRGFILHRFGQRLGGLWVGLAVTTIGFGAGHFDQGYDVALAVGAAGLLWGWLYVRRRSVAAAMTCHAGFNTAQVLQQMLIKALAH